MRSVFRLTRAIHGALLCAVAGVVLAQERLVELSIAGSSDRQFVVLYEEGQKLYIDVEDLASFGVDTRTVDLTVVPDCRFCFDLSQLGELERSAGDTRINVRLNSYGSTLISSVTAAARRSSPLQAAASPGMFVNYAVTGYESESTQAIFGALLESGISAGRHGVLRYGHLLSSDDEDRRYYTRYEFDLDGLRSQVVLGDVATRPGRLSSSTRLAGISLRRNYLMAPEVLSEVTGHYSPLDSSLTSFDVYRLGSFTRGAIGGSEYFVDDVYVSAGSNSIKVLLRDQLGREQLIERALVDARGVLARGVLDYAIDAGYRYDPLARKYRDVPAIAGRVRYGLTDTATGDYYGILNNGASFSSGGIEVSTGRGQISAGGGYGYVREVEGDTRSQKRWGLEAAYSQSFGAYGFFVSTFRNLVDSQTISGGSFGFRARALGWPVQATVISTDQFNALGVLAHKSFGEWSVGFDGRADDAAPDDDVSFSVLASVGYNFGKNTARMALQERDDGRLYSSSYFMRDPAGTLTASVGVDRSENSDDGSAEHRPTGSLTYNDHWIEADLSSRSNHRGQRSNSGIVAGGLALVDGQVLPMRRVYPTSSVAVAKVDFASALVNFDGLAVPVNNRGYAAAPVWAWSQARVGLDPNSLPAGWSSAQSSKTVVGRAGGFAKVHLDVERPGYFLEIPWMKSPRVRVNNKPFDHYPGTGAYITEEAGAAVVEVDGVRYQVTVPDVGLEVPTFTLERDGSLRKRDRQP